MVDRADITAILLVVVGTITAAFFMVFFPNSFGSYGSAIAFLVITAPTYLYAVYWAFDIRRALAVRIYRNQAFGIGVIVLAIWLTNGVYIALSGLVSLQLYSALSTLTWDFLLLTLFYWIDASVLASRRSDPLLRDTLHWSKLRIPLWIAVLLAVGGTLTLQGYSEITDNVSLLNQLAVGTLNNAILNFVYGFPVFVAIICGIVFLPAIAVRAKWDRTLRRHFSWFALFVLLFLGTTGAGNIFPLSGPIILLCVGLALYKSAKSLVPLNRIPSQELAPELMP